MKYKNESIILFKYNFSIVILVFILILILLTNQVLVDRVAALGREVLKIDLTDTYNEIIVNEIPITRAYTKPGDGKKTFISDVFRFILRLFGCDSENPVSILISEHPMFVTYEKIMIHYPEYNDLNNPSDERKTGVVGRISFDGNSTQSLNEGDVISGFQITADNDKTYSDNVEYETEFPGIYDLNNIAFINETNINIEKVINEILINPLPFHFDKKTSGIIIYHTHTTESFITRPDDIYDPDIYTRSNDPNKNICRVGEELFKCLKNVYDLNVIHDTTVHDYPVYNSAYSNAYKTISGLIQSNKNTDIIIDIHRNALDSMIKLRLPYETKNATVAKISFVVATGEIGLPHDDWKYNLQLALRLTSILEYLYPGITEPIFISKYRYNQHISKGALLAEIGAEGNLLEECILTSRILAEALNILIDN